MKSFTFLFSLTILGCCLWGRTSLLLVGLIFFLLLLYTKEWTGIFGIIFALLVRQGFLWRQDVSLESKPLKNIQILSGVAITTTKRTAFVLQDDQKKEYYVTHKDTIQIGDQVVIKGYYTPATYFGRDFHGTGSYRQEVLQSPLGGAFDYPRRLAMKGYQGALSSFEVKKIGVCNECLVWYQKSILRLIEEVQRWRGDSEQAGLLLGLLVGHRGMINKQTTEDFTQSGLVHLIAVSGGNLVMIASLFGLLLFRLPVYVRFAVIGIGMTMYGLLCGFDSSVVRALIMAILGIVAIFLGKPTLSWRLITVTFLLMLAWNPLYLLYDLGFQLSFMAVVGIVLFQEWFGSVRDEKIQDYKKLQKSCIRAIWSHLLVSLGAFAFTLPILFLSMGKINITGLLSNIIIVPFIPVLQIGGFVSTWTSEWIATQGVILWMLDELIYIAKWTQMYGVQVVIKELWVKWVMVGLRCAILFYQKVESKSAKE